MRVVSVFVALATTVVVSAQQNVVPIQVGNTTDSPGGPIVFTPNSITATNNTIVSFQFTGFPGNHTVTQSSFDSPCEPLANGFDSGWVSVPQSLTPPPTWNLTITNDQAPIWFYCKQLKGPNSKTHCNLGMVGVINVKPGAKNLEAFVSAASAAPSVGQEEGGFSGVGAVATGAPELVSGASYANPRTATAPAGPSASGGGNSTGGNSAGGGGGGALATGVSSITIGLAALFGVAMVL
ncbi:hypothetical protein C8R43DRAFT_613323 [Mycena crocata]|nr:hypothetical protein C8R43DRAFT_613323 [Mycena crocata]